VLKLGLGLWLKLVEVMVEVWVVVMAGVRFYVGSGLGSILGLGLWLV